MNDRTPFRALLAMSLILLLILTAGTGTASSHASEFSGPDPEVRDTCPVCGMLVARYPAWIATVLYEDGHSDHFDGAKDLFKYLFDLPRYAPGRSGQEISAIGVTEYYGLTRIDAHSAWYVIGSDVLGPMGHELVPLATADDASEFLEDHEGTRILRFDEVTPDLLQDLDAGRVH
ncbi:nitrous oxide reductase accessory protein NosL [Thioalkalivibrio paradoxus]|uniref:Lipoprotein involved in nitrous oxide reduction n=1 Tax=Thioalkalivibrio paradoxus ARh 1 TaxID=713585 RepID=W0DLD5_9GAMM|nr:nitrous oxide reductase accessory protein NosL [Thioalkalivibrio paradoxus]AHE99409.1 lipoprotein involved in nitrous oxide reduction [Thioalkalivibrio paradoxus ARh 1]